MTPYSSGKIPKRKAITTGWESLDNLIISTILILRGLFSYTSLTVPCLKLVKHNYKNETVP